MRKLLMASVLGLMMAAMAPLGAVELKEGKQYTVLDPQRAVESQDKIEVTEFFWYGCSHCYHLDPVLAKWLKNLPKDASFRRVPAVFSGKGGQPGSWGPLAKTYYALEALGVIEKLHPDIFDAVQKDGKNLGDVKELGEWAASKGLDKDKVVAAYNSFAVQSKVMRAQQLTEQYRFDGVPALFVNGRYGVVNGPNLEETMAVTDALIDKARKDRGGKK